MALQRSFSFWPQIKIYTNCWPSQAHISCKTSTVKPKPTTLPSMPPTPEDEVARKDNTKRNGRFKHPSRCVVENLQSGGHKVDCVVQFVWLEKHITSRWFKDPSSYEPNFNIV